MGLASRARQNWPKKQKHPQFGAPPRRANCQNQKIFLIEPGRLAASVVGLNNSLAIAVGELQPKKYEPISWLARSFKETPVGLLLLLQQWPVEELTEAVIPALLIRFDARRHCRNFQASANSHWLIFVRRVKSRISVEFCFVATLVVLLSVSPTSEIILQSFSYVSI